MASDVRDVALAGCLSRVAALRERVANLERAYRDRAELAGSLLLLRALAVLISHTERRLIDMRSKADDVPVGQGLPELDPTEVQELMELDRQVLAETVKTLETVVGVCVAVVSVPHSRDFDPFVRPIGNLARTMADGTEVIFRPLPSYTSYQISRPLNLQLDLNVTDAPVALRNQVAALPTLVYLNYPATEEASTLHHLLIGHELGHLALRRTDVADHEGPVGDALASAAIERFKKGLNGEAQQTEPSDLELLSDRATKWFIELACDRLGLRMVGPAYFLALLEHAALTRWFYDENQQRKSLDETASDYDKYPPMAWRVGSLWALVEEYLPKVEAGLPATSAADAVFDEANSIVPSWDAVLKTREAKIIEDALAEYMKIEPALLGKAAYPVDRFGKDLDLVWAKLESHIAPAERICSRQGPRDLHPERWQKGEVWSEPIDWRSILNGGYVHWLHIEAGQGFSHDISGWRDRAELQRHANALLQGAVELSQIQEQASALREQLRQLDIRPEVI